MGITKKQTTLTTAKKVSTVPFATNNGILSQPQSNGTTDTNKTFRSYHKALVDAYDPVLAFGNYEVKSGTTGTEALGPNAITVSASIEYPANSGTTYPVYFAGQKTIVIQPGTTVFSDAVPMQIYENDGLQVRTNVQVTAGQKWVNAFETYGTNGEGSGDGDLTASGTITTGHIYMYGPVGLFGKSNTTRPCVGLVGDSIMTGQGDSTYLGFASRALVAANIPHIKISRGGEFQSVFATMVNHRNRLLLLQYCSHILVNHGINDIRQTGGLTLVTMQANARAVWRAFSLRGAKVYQCTVTPTGASTDAYVTVANQTVQANNTIRVAWNQYLRSKPTEPYLTGTIDVGTTVESAIDSGLWAVRASAPYSITSDGTHPNDYGHALMAAPITSWIATL